MEVPHWVSTALGWANDGILKTGLLLVGGFIWKSKPALVNRSIPAVLGVCSLVTAVLSAMFPPTLTAVAPASFVFTTLASVPLYATAGWVQHSASWVWNTLFPLACAIAIQSGAKNTGQWARDGMMFVWPGGRPPVR